MQKRERIEAECTACGAVVELSVLRGNMFLPRHNIPDTRFNCPGGGSSFIGWHRVREA
jgi:ssDNA-binding Zn-finger/Zn-ribbon topoisomerase 1